MKIQETIQTSAISAANFAQVFFDGHREGEQHCEFGFARPTTPVYCWIYIYVLVDPERLVNAITGFSSMTFVDTVPGRSRLMFELKDKDWSIFEPWWRIFHANLLFEGLIATTEQVSDELPNTMDAEILNNWWEKRGRFLGMTLKQVAARAGVGYSTLTNWRSDNGRARAYVIRKPDEDEPG